MPPEKVINTLSYSKQSKEDIKEYINHPALQTVLNKHKDVFQGMGKLKNYQLKLHIDESVTPVQQPLRSLPYHTRKKVSKEITRLLENDGIERAEGPTSWINPIVVVPKSNGVIRICFDMCRENESLIRERHQIPKPEEILLELNNAKYFSKIDLREGYHQIELDPSSRHVTAFITHEGTFQSKRLVYGAKPAFEHFQKIIEQTIAGCPGTKSISINEMKERLDKLFDTIAKNGLKINLKKCIFGVQELTFAGLNLTNKGIIPDSLKVDAVTKAKVPTNVTEVRSFLGLVNYCSQFIPGYAELTEPLRKLTTKNTKFKCSNEHEHSFEKLKLGLVNSEAMAYYIPDAETKVIVDASPIGLGAILSQKQKTGEFRPV